jgi:hypothetical protein
MAEAPTPHPLTVQVNRPALLPLRRVTGHHDHNSQPARASPRSRGASSRHLRAGRSQRTTPTDALFVATASGDHTTQPAGPVWLPTGHTTRVRLADLPTTTDVEQRAA